uniref:ATP synthase complex subunit 8 n=1 Tax=Caprella scaura TaxID=703580 RepID=E2RVM6_9CRUS|nr:ATP synthase F0 subunit 8 [Caprella scaura]BAJ23200.1 ATP synthase F0 subunit 8 [Caprella scaura]
MPQMAPLMWLNIMMTALLVIFSLALMSYFSSKTINLSAKNCLTAVDNNKWLW